MHNHKVEASLLLTTNSHSNSSSPTSQRKKISIEKGVGAHTNSKRRQSPMGARAHGAGGEETSLEIVGQGPKATKPAQAFNGVGGNSGSAGGGRRASDDTNGPVNPLQDLLQNRITDTEFANIIERQSPENRWMSVRDLASQVKRLITLLTFTTSISSELDLDKSSEKMSQQVCEILNADRASLYLIDEGKGMLVSKSTALTTQGKAQSTGEIRVPMGVGIAGHVAMSGETRNVDDTSREPLFWSDVDKQSGYRTKTVLCMPVMDVEGRVVAVVEALNKRKPGGTGIVAFDGEDERVMKTLAHHAGLSLRNSQLYHSSLVSQRKVQVLLEVASQLASELETTSLITQIMTKARDLLDADRCTLFLLDKERGELWSKVAEGSKEIRVPVTKGIAGHVVTTGQILNIKDAYQDTRFNPEIDKRTGYRTKRYCPPIQSVKRCLVLWLLGFIFCILLYVISIW
jgi:GAF domain-containing protein